MVKKASVPVQGIEQNQKIFTLGIPIDLSYQTNRIILGLSLITFAVFLVCQLIIGASFVSALYSAASAAFAVFLSWATAREIDPGNDWSAFAALPLTFIFALLYGSPSFMGLLFILLFCRVLSGTTGMRATVIDSASLLMLGGLLHYNGSRAALLLLALVYIFDTLLKPANRRQVYFAAAAVALFGALLVILPGRLILPQDLSLSPVAVSIPLMAAAAVLIYLTRGDRTYNYRGGLKLRRSRIFASQALAVLFILAELFTRGTTALMLYYPAAAAYYGTALYHLARSTRRR